MTDLPKLTAKQQSFVLHYSINGGNASEAYRASYDCSKMTSETITVEASRLLKNPKVSPWLKQAESNVQQVFEDEIKYSAKDCFDELDEMKTLALGCTDKFDNPNVAAAIKAVELKGKLAGHFTEKHKIESVSLVDVLDQLK